MFTLPKLDYSYGSLEPHIDAATMEIHYTKHHQAYIDKANEALQKHPELEKKSVEEILKNLSQLPEDVRTALQNNAGGHYNHSLFWQWMKPKGGGVPRGTIAQKIDKYFVTFAKFQELFNQAAKTRFGSGWAWLSIDKDGKLVVTSTANQDTPLSHGLIPLLGLDVWEHAYYLKYQNKRPDYINAWWNVINWDFVEDRYKQSI